MKNILFTGFAAALIANSATLAADSVSLTAVEPTPLFPKPAADQPLKQLVRLNLVNPGEPFTATARVTLAGKALEAQPVKVAKAKSNVNILIPDITRPTPVTIELLDNAGAVLATQSLDWQPQKKWTIYSCAYSHQDLGYGDYAYRTRTSVRLKNIELPLRFCRETDTWPDNSKFRYNIETSEVLNTFIGFYGKDAARELAQRMREGRIQLSGIHNTANTEELSHELMARLFYMSGRHAVDILGVPASKTIQNIDVVGLTWPMATYATEAGFENCFHGFNGGCMPASAKIVRRQVTAEVAGTAGQGRSSFAVANEPNFFWEGPDGSKILRRATPYGDLALLPHSDNRSPFNASLVINMLRLHEKEKWPFSTILSQDGFDFDVARLGVARGAKQWADNYAYPQIRIATFDEYFNAIRKEMSAEKIELKTIGGDENNQWSDQAYADAATMGAGRLLGEALPVVESVATISQALTGGGDHWLPLFQAYNRLLQYAEHTNGSSNVASQKSSAFFWRDTEREENREMVSEAGAFAQDVFANTSRRLADAIARPDGKNLIVFNALPQMRTDSVRADIPEGLIPVDALTGTACAVQRMPDGTAVFVARDVPATGWKLFELKKDPSGQTASSQKPDPSGNSLENQYYKLAFNPATGAITSLFDKTLGRELIEQDAPHAFNEYLYEYRTGKKGRDFDSVWSRMEQANRVSVTRGPVEDVLTIEGKAEGVRSLKQTISLRHDAPRVDFGISLDKAPMTGTFNVNKEAVFIALPFDIPGFTIHHELAGNVIEPFRQQIGGSATCHYAIRGFTDFSNEKYGVTISPMEGGLVCYGEPTSAAVTTLPYDFLRDRPTPPKSRLYLYLLNNMFSTNIHPDQQGPANFRWSLHSHAGDWKAGGAAQFSRTVQRPLLAWRADGKNDGARPASGSFMSVDASNITSSVIKSAEMNGRGFIIRLNETTGQETTATVTLPLLPLESVAATSLVEDDRGEPISHGPHSFKVKLPPFGVKTFRVTGAKSTMVAADAHAKPVADMQVELSWKCDDKNVSHYNIYRDTAAECEPTMLNFIGQSASVSFTDRPQANISGWIRSCLQPKTAYHYRIVPVDRFNNPGTSVVVSATTLDSATTNLPPVAVEGLRVTLVTPVSPDNVVSLLFRTSCEPDVAAYEIHRGTQPGFAAGQDTQIGTVRSDDQAPPNPGAYPISNSRYKIREYDHAIFADKSAAPATANYYKIRAVDTAGQPGAFSEEVVIHTK